MTISIDLSDDVELAKQGNIQAFTRLIAQTKNTISSIALAIVKDIDSSEEVAQMVYIASWQNLTQLKSNSSFLPWLRQMTRYTAYNFLRDNKIARKITGDKAEQLLLDFCHPQSSLDDSLLRAEQSAILEDFINDLPDESREVVLLYYREEQSTQQVAQLLTLSEANVRKKLSRVRGLLKKKLIAKYGKLIFSTIPTAGFTSIVLATLATSSPVAAASIATASSEGSVLSKLAFVFGGLFIGVVSAILSVFWAAKIPLEKISNLQAKKQLRKYRNQTVIWLIFSGVLLVLSYEFTTSWQGPITVYTIFALGLVKQVKLMAAFSMKHINSGDNVLDAVADKKVEKIWGVVGLCVGLLAGYSGLIMDLLQQGRM